jgi:ribonucleoside-diphosphate reductase beta chain
MSSKLDTISQHSTLIDSQSWLFRRNPVYKPFRYPFAYEAWLQQQRLHWLPEEVSMAEDLRDWNFHLSPSEKNLLTQIFRFFTQMDVEVGECYLKTYCRYFEPIEIKMMLAAFVNMESIHIAGYAHLLDSLGISEVEYQAFFKYKEMKDKWEYMQDFCNPQSVSDMAMTLAVFSAFTEGLQLFASFAILLNFPRFNKMKGMGQIVTWSVRDETLHVHSLVQLFHIMIQEHPHIWTPELKEAITNAGREIVKHEDAFVNLAFEQGELQGLTAAEVKNYVRFIADRRLDQLGLPKIYHISENPLPWMDSLLMGVEFSNFFETRATEYSKASTTGTWSDVFGNE